MVGDFLREVAVLWAALYPLEAIINKTFDWFYCGWIYLMAAALMYLGMILEGSEEGL
jgi:hypothetical protein